MSRDTPLTFLGQLREQWQDSRLVRLGAWSGLAMVLIYALLAGFDEADAGRERNRGLQTELARLKALAKESNWPERRREATGLKVAYDTTVWTDADLALTEAGVQDWLRNTTQRLGLKVREITLVREEPGAKVSASDLPPNYVVLRARVGVELQRTALLTLLAEMANQERHMVVDRLTLRTLSQPATAELDVRVLARPGVKP
jgi:hypothetical protein